MRDCVHPRKTTMPPARAGGIVENGSSASGIMYCEGRPPVRTGGIAETRTIASGYLGCKKGSPPARAGGMAF